MIKINKQTWIGIIASLLIIIISFILFKIKFIDIKILYFISGIALLIALLPLFVILIMESKLERNKEQMFLEFVRDLVEGVKSGTPISKSILNIKTKDYGSLSPSIQKLANQISLGIPVKDAFGVFSKDSKSEVIRRAITLIQEAEKSGGKIEAILESVAFSVSQIEKLKKERKAAVYNLAVQGYIIFLIFIVIILVMQFKILPLTSNLNVVAGDMGEVDIKGVGINITNFDPSEIANSFLFLLMTQGFFAGLVIGKIAEGEIKLGLKHSFVLVFLAFLLSTGARIFLKA